MKLACARGFDGIRLLDDDAIPRRDALFVLQPATPALPRTTAALRGAAREFGTIATLHRRRLSWLLGEEHRVSRHWYGAGPVVIDTGSVVGLLGSANATARVGLPGAAFFIAYDDTEFSLRLKRAGYTLWLVPSSIVDHMRALQGRPRASTSERKHDFNVRNRIVVKMTYAGWPLLSGASVCLIGIGAWLGSRRPFHLTPSCILCHALVDGWRALGRLSTDVGRTEKKRKK